MEKGPNFANGKPSTSLERALGLILGSLLSNETQSLLSVINYSLEMHNEPGSKNFRFAYCITLQHTTLNFKFREIVPFTSDFI